MSDVVIRGMEMPKDCSYCKMAYDGAWCLLSEESNDCVEGGMMWRKCPYGGRPSWCPIVPIPEGHGDLIDRDAFRAENGLNAKCEHCPRNTYKCQNDMIHTKMEFCGMLDDAPVIVPTEGGTDNGN